MKLSKEDLEAFKENENFVKENGWRRGGEEILLLLIAKKMGALDKVV